MVCHLIVFFSLSRLRGNDVASSPDLSGGGCCCNSSQHKIKKKQDKQHFPSNWNISDFETPSVGIKRDTVTQHRNASSHSSDLTTLRFTG